MRIAGMLDNVSFRVKWLPNNVPEVTFDRLNEHYRGVSRRSSRLVLRHRAFESRRGADASRPAS